MNSERATKRQNDRDLKRKLALRRQGSEIDMNAPPRPEDDAAASDDDRFAAADYRDGDESPF